MIRVALADDHQVVRVGVRRIVEAEPDLRVAVEAKSGAELLRLLATTRCDVLVLDLAMPGLHGRPLVERLRAEHPGLAIVIFSMYPEDPLALHFLRDGVHAYVSKERPPGDLIDAIRLAARDKCYLPGPIESSPRAAPAGAHELPEPARYGAMFLMLQGFDDAHIAAELRVPVEAVGRFVRAVRAGEIETPMTGLVGGAPPAPDAAPQARPPLRLGPVSVDLDSGEIHHPHGPRTLTETELNLLMHLAAHDGQTLSGRALLTDVWGYADAARSRTVVMTISRLRRKIEVDPAHPRHLLTIAREGYRLEIEPGHAG